MTTVIQRPLDLARVEIAKLGPAQNAAEHTIYTIMGQKLEEIVKTQPKVEFLLASRQFRELERLESDQWRLCFELQAYVSAITIYRATHGEPTP